MAQSVNSQCNLQRDSLIEPCDDICPNEFEYIEYANYGLWLRI